MYEVLKGLVAVANKRMGAELPETKRPGCISAVDREKNVMVIRPKGIKLGSLNEESMPVISLADGSQLEGEYLPVDDYLLHLRVYREFPDIQTISHVYLKWPNYFSQAGRSIPVLSRKHAGNFKNEIPCTAAYGEEGLVETMRAMERLPQGAVLMRNEGMLLWAPTPLKTLDCAKEMKKIAHSAWNTLAVCEDVKEAAMPTELAGQIYQERQEKKQSFCPIGVPGQRVSAGEQRKICLEMLVYFDKVCRENGIKYSLTGGSLLGAVRHAGFIPWDDDADVFLTRPEYDKLAAAFSDDNRFVFMTREKDPSFSYVFGRLVDKKTYIAQSPGTASFGSGVFLDICVVDGLPKSEFMRKMHMKYMRFLVRGRRATIRNPHSKSYKNKGPLMVMAKNIMRRFITLSKWNDWMGKAMKRYPFDNAEYVGNFTSQYGKKELLPRSTFSDYIDVSFEGYTLMICTGYKEYLSRIYGKKYMSFPKKSKRKGHHPNVTYWVE